MTSVSLGLDETCAKPNIQAIRKWPERLANERGSEPSEREFVQEWQLRKRLNDTDEGVRVLARANSTKRSRDEIDKNLLHSYLLQPLTNGLRVATQKTLIHTPFAHSNELPTVLRKMPPPR